MWSTTCPNTQFHNLDATNHVVSHTCDSTHGQSGSPMYTADNNVSVCCLAFLLHLLLLLSCLAAHTLFCHWYSGCSTIVSWQVQLCMASLSSRHVYLLQLSIQVNYCGC